MREKILYDALTNIPDELIVEAKNTKLKRASRARKGWTAIAAAAACAVLTVLLVQPFGDTSEGALADVIFPRALAFDDYDAQHEVFLGNPVDSALITAIGEFSYKTASRLLSGGSGNVNYSPLSLYYALALAASGADGETADELLALLGMADKDALIKQCGNLYRRLYSENEIGKLKIGNSLWMDTGIDWKSGFVKKAAENLYAHSFSVDFTDKKTGKSMAKWVSDSTGGALTPDISANIDQIMTIFNTISFYDEWMDKFDKQKTAEDKFYPPGSAAVNCDFMNRTYASHYFAHGDGFTRSSLGLKNMGSMLFILPDEGVSPRELLSSPERMREVFEGGTGSTGEVVWQIPKFSFNSRLDAADALRGLGVSSAFTPDADFSGITDQQAFLTGIRQDTRIGIDENGVEASSFTQIDYATAMPPQDRADMILNRPFIFAITTHEGSLLFVGICDNPSD